MGQLKKLNEISTIAVLLCACVCVLNAYPTTQDHVLSNARNANEQISTDLINETAEQGTDKRTKRDTTDQPQVIFQSGNTNGPSFEEYEKAYLISQTMNYLKQLYFSVKERENKADHQKNELNRLDSSSRVSTSRPLDQNPTSDRKTTTSSVRTDPLLEHWLHELGQMSVDHISHILDDVRKSALSGEEQSDLSSLCCSMG